MLTLILLVLGLYVVQIYLVSILCFSESGLSNDDMIKAGLGSRDDTPSLTVRGLRAERALGNLKESLPIFITLAILAIVLEKDLGLAVTSATVFFIARVVYVPLYVKGVPYLRSGVWVVAFLSLFAMAFSLV